MPYNVRGLVINFLCQLSEVPRRPSPSQSLVTVGTCVRVWSSVAEEAALSPAPAEGGSPQRLMQSLKDVRCALGVLPAVWGACPLHSHTTHTSPLRRSGWHQGWNYIAAPKQNKTNPTRAVKAWITSPGSVGTRTAKGPPVCCRLQNHKETLIKQSLLCFTAGSTWQSPGCIWFHWGRRESLRLGLRPLSETLSFADSSYFNPQWCL